MEIQNIKITISQFAVNAGYTDITVTDNTPVLLYYTVSLTSTTRQMPNYRYIGPQVKNTVLTEYWRNCRR